MPSRTVLATLMAEPAHEGGKHHFTSPAQPRAKAGAQPRVWDVVKGTLARHPQHVPLDADTWARAASFASLVADTRGRTDSWASLAADA